MTATSQHFKNWALVVFVIHQDLTRWLRTYTDTSRFLRTKFWHQSQKVWHQSQIYFVINFQFYLSWAPHSPYLSLASVMPVTCTRQVYRSSKGPKVLVWWSVLFLLLGGGRHIVSVLLNHWKSIELKSIFDYWKKKTNPKMSTMSSTDSVEPGNDELILDVQHAWPCHLDSWANWLMKHNACNRSTLEPQLHSTGGLGLLNWRDAESTCSQERT